MESGYTSVHGLKALKVLNMDREAPSDHIQEEIQQNLSTLKYKLEVIVKILMFFLCLVKEAN